MDEQALQQLVDDLDDELCRKGIYGAVIFGVSDDDDSIRVIFSTHEDARRLLALLKGQ